MTQQEHGCDAFLALLRNAALDTGAVTPAWRHKAELTAIKPANSGCAAIILCGTAMRR